MVQKIKDTDYRHIHEFYGIFTQRMQFTSDANSSLWGYRKIDEISHNLSSNTVYPLPPRGNRNMFVVIYFGENPSGKGTFEC